jgi:hypothetical protein
VGAGVASLYAAGVVTGVAALSAAVAAGVGASCAQTLSQGKVILHPKINMPIPQINNLRFMTIPF